MRKIRFLSCAGVLATLLLAGCGETPNPTPTPTPTPTPVPQVEYAEVFLLCGQSNMEGNTKYSGLDSLFTTWGYNDYDAVRDGMPEVKTTYMGVGYGQLTEDGKNLHASNTENKLEPKFLNTKVGMGKDDNCMGPELGCAYGLRKEGLATEEHPVYFVKASFSGSGFAQSGTDWNWKIGGKEKGLYQNFVKAYLQKSLDLIAQESGFTPRLRALLWHQGESDSDAAKIPTYAENLNELLGAIRTDFADYGYDGEGSNIALVDGMIYDANGNPWGGQNAVDLNTVKLNNANADEKRYVVNTSSVLEGGSALKAGNAGGDSMHYTTEDSFKLGMQYAQVIIDNDLLAE